MIINELIILTKLIHFFYFIFFQDSGSNEKDAISGAVKGTKKKVQFRDPGRESRDERLERLVKLLKTEEKENQNALKKVKGQFGKNLREVKESMRFSEVKLFFSLAYLFFKKIIFSS